MLMLAAAEIAEATDVFRAHSTVAGATAPRRNRKGGFRLVPLLACAACAGMACGGPGPDIRGDRSDPLIVLAGAVAVEKTRENEGTVIYQVPEEFPAKAAVEGISQRLEHMGWRPRDEDFLNPGTPLSPVRGWTNHLEGTVERPRLVYQWTGQWEDASKRIVWYVLTYQGVVREGGEIGAQGPLNVRATLLSAGAVDVLRRSASGGGGT